MRVYIALDPLVGTFFLIGAAANSVLNRWTSSSTRHCRSLFPLLPIGARSPAQCPLCLCYLFSIPRQIIECFPNLPKQDSNFACCIITFGPANIKHKFWILEYHSSDAIAATKLLTALDIEQTAESS